MQPVKRKSVGGGFSLCVQLAFIIGTVNADGTSNFAPITWVSVTNEKDDDYLLVVSMFGSKRTKQNVMWTGQMSVNLVSTDLLTLMDYFGTHHAQDEKKDAVPYEIGRGDVLDVPVLQASRWVYECEVAQAVPVGESTTFFCRIRNVQIDERMQCADGFDVDLTRLDPVIYSGIYHSLGKRLGRIGDFSPVKRGQPKKGQGGGNIMSEDQLQSARQIIDEVDREMARLFVRRMEAAAQAAAYKRAHGLPVLDAERERAVIQRNAARVEREELRGWYVRFLQDVMDLSKQYQQALLAQGEEDTP